MSRTERYTCADIIDALDSTHGMVYKAAERLGCSHTTVYNYIERHPTVEDAFEKARGLMLDQAEVELKKAVDEGERWAIKFALQFLGSARGYTPTEKQDVNLSGGVSVAYVNDWRERND